MDPENHRRERKREKMRNYAGRTWMIRATGTERERKGERERPERDDAVGEFRCGSATRSVEGREKKKEEKDGRAGRSGGRWGKKARADLGTSGSEGREAAAAR